MAFICKGNSKYFPYKTSTLLNKQNRSIQVIICPKETNTGQEFTIRINGMFGWHKFGFGFGFEEAQIQIFCLDNLKELDLDLAQIHLGFQGSKSMDLKYLQKPRNLEISHSHTYCFSLGSVSLFLAVTHKLFFPLTLGKATSGLFSQLLSSSLTSLILSFY